VPGAQAIGRAIAVLRAVAAAPEGIGAAGVAAEVGLSRSTAVRLLKALAAEGLVREAGAGAGRGEVGARYAVGPGLLELAGGYLERQDVRRVAQPYLWGLAETSRETVNLAIQDGTDTICIAQSESPQAVRAVNWVGRRLPAHATATGKAWLAYQDGATVEALLGRLGGPDGRLPGYTEHTLVDPRAVGEDLARTSRRGYAVAREELELWLSAVAAPVFDHLGAVVATVAVSGPSFRLGPRQVTELGALTAATARRVSAALGHRGGDASGSAEGAGEAGGGGDAGET
jgi:DNA-binding IclR family transcriptional regulator